MVPKASPQSGCSKLLKEVPPEGCALRIGQVLGCLGAAHVVTQELKPVQLSRVSQDGESKGDTQRDPGRQDFRSQEK